MRKLPLVCALAALPLALAGCGGGGGGDGIPAELVGTYTTTLEAGDIPANPAPELEGAAGEWELVIAISGAPDGGPALAINHPEEGNLEAPGLTVDGDQFLLEDEECAAGPDGKAIARNPGQTRLELVFDDNGTPDDPFDDIELSREIVKGSTGRSDDFCDAAVPALT